MLFIFYPPPPPPAVEAAGKVLTGKQLANVLAENYENESDLHVDPLRQREAKNEKKKGSKKSTAEKNEERNNTI